MENDNQSNNIVLQVDSTSVGVSSVAMGEEKQNGKVGE